METVYNACPRDFYDTCSIVTTVYNGRIVKVEGNKKHPITQGFLCAKVGRYATDLLLLVSKLQRLGQMDFFILKVGRIVHLAQFLQFGNAIVNETLVSYFISAVMNQNVTLGGEKLEFLKQFIHKLKL